MAIEFTLPSFVQNNDADTIQKRMMESLPADIDNMPGGFPWDFTMPTAIEKSELIQFHLVQTLMIMFPMWAWGEWLDYHASIAGIKRKEAGFASGKLQINGLEGTSIPAGSVFVTPATDNGPSIEFEALEDYVIDSSGVIEIDVIAKESGKGSNVQAGTITLMSKPIQGITKVSNGNQFSGGTQTEDDESLRERIQQVNESQGVSYVGSDSDYIRWAKEVIGVGSVIVVPEWMGPGTVKLVIVDSNGEAANDYILDEVYNHIMSPDNSMERLAPIGALLTVAGPALVEIEYTCSVDLSEGTTPEAVEEKFREKIEVYYETAKNEGTLKYNRIAALLMEVEGVKDFTELKINGSVNNITFDIDEYPKTINVTVVAL